MATFVRPIGGVTGGKEEGILFSQQPIEEMIGVPAKLS
jgi:hypothetical protein